MKDSNGLSRPSARRERRGVALVMVLVTILLLASVTAVASNSARTSAQVSLAVRAASVARAMSENGIVSATAVIDRRLRLLSTDSVTRDDFLSSLEPGVSAVLPLSSDTIGDGAFVVSVVDVSSRLDVNDAGTEGWSLFLRPFVGAIESLRIAQIIDAQVRGESVAAALSSDPMNDAARSQDSLVSGLLGRAFSPRNRRPFESLDDLLKVPGVSAELFHRIAPMLTVDGNGTINRRAAPPQVLAAASGSVVDRPARLLLISRGWMNGHPLTREIQAVYDIEPDGLHLVRWRESER